MSQAIAKKNNIFDKLALFAAMFRYAAKHNQDFAKEQYQSFQEMRARIKDFGIESLKDKRVLDVGCGKSMWLSLLIHNSGAEVSGIDTEVVGTSGIAKYIKIIKQNGIERALRTLVWELIYAGPYYKGLSEHAGKKLSFKGLDARQGDATKLEFADETFDLIVSHEVLEHVPDIPATAKDLARVLKKGGITHLYVHNYASVSGGHHIAWKYPDTEPSDTVPPWDHLRENKFPNIPSWINRLRISEYRKAFEEHFEILDWVYTEQEGRALLTEDIKAELSDYSEEELLNKGFVIIAKKK